MDVGVKAGRASPAGKRHPQADLLAPYMKSITCNTFKLRGVPKTSPTGSVGNHCITPCLVDRGMVITVCGCLLIEYPLQPVFGGHVGETRHREWVGRQRSSLCTALQGMCLSVCCSPPQGGLLPGSLLVLGQGRSTPVPLSAPFLPCRRALSARTKSG